MSRFQGLKQTAAKVAAPALAAAPDAASRTGTIAKARENKKLVGGYSAPMCAGRCTSSRLRKALRFRRS